MTDHVAVLAMQRPAPLLIELQPIKNPPEHGPFVTATFRDETGFEWQESSADLLVIKGWYEQAARG